MIKKIIFALTLLFAFCSMDSYAARFGNGKSFGQQKTSSYRDNKSQSGNNRHEQQKPQQSQQQTQPPQKSSFASKLLPMLAGLSMGALLASLFGHGLGGGIAWMFIILAVLGIVFYLVSKLINSRSNAKNIRYFQNSKVQTDTGYQTPLNAYYEQPYNQTPAQYQEPAQTQSTSSYETSFNTEEFLRNAKVTFIRMQNAYDTKNLDDIKKFTTPEVFAEIKMQIQERHNDTNQTDVIRINASFIDEYQADHMSSAAVLFSGQIREEPSAPPVNVNEVWHFTKYQDNNWLIAGIEQRNFQ